MVLVLPMSTCPLCAARSSLTAPRCATATHCVNGQGALRANVVFIKIPRCASTTTAALVRHLAGSHSLNGVDDDYSLDELDAQPAEPWVWTRHSYYPHLEPAIARLRRPAVFVSMVREPKSRCMSHFRLQMGFDCNGNSREDWPVPGTYRCADKDSYYVESDLLRAKLDFVSNQCMGKKGNLMWRYLKSGEEGSVAQALSNFHLVGVVDRGVDAFAVLLAELLGLPLVDVLYFSTHVRTAYHADAGTRVGGEWSAPTDPEEPPQVRGLLDSAEFAQHNAIDYDLVAAASRNFDAAVARLPAGRFDARRAEFERLQRALLDDCSDEERHVCYEDAHICDCGPSACGVPCLQRLAAAERAPRPPPLPPLPPPPPPVDVPLVQQSSACEPWCATPKHCGNGVRLFVKCGGCAWCGEAAAGELLPAVYLPPPSPLPSPPPPLASWTETAETGASAAPGDDGSLSLSSSLAASASRIGARSNLTSLSSLTQVDLHELHHAVTDELTKEALDAPLAVGIVLAVVLVLLCSACFCACLACRARGHARPSTYGHTRAALDEFDDDDTEADFEMARRGRVHHGGRRTYDKYRRGTGGY